MEINRNEIEKIKNELKYYYGKSGEEDILDIALDDNNFMRAELDEDGIISAYINSMKYNRKLK